MRLCALLWIMVAYPVQFGERVQGHVYIDRPGAYGIALSMQRNILVVAVENLLALPGGGIEKGETSEEGLAWEFQEETGYRVEILNYLGSAGQYVYAREEQIHFNKLCEFYEVELIGEPVDAMDSGHQVRLISVDQAIASLTEKAHRWAVARARDR